MKVADRAVNGVIALGCGVILAIAFYMEYQMGLEPCPLCLMQRVMFAAAGLLCLLAFLHNPAAMGQRLYAALVLLFALGGAALASRQLWLQSLPAEEVPACGPGIYFMLERFPFTEVLQSMIMGTGDCAEVQWTLFSISIPGWALIGFIGLALLALAQMLRKRDLNPWLKT
ncbi:disulfide bond formation protein B [Balneatrix alpica]|uniref:disulfide bond formation protein B n=1 Tax=Balneatrix alpica TaxID=75684 RepID=UPI0027394AE2|nr:disulfide bond formation protein B [Balneatrix alpica]